MDERGQGALEYLLIIGGAILLVLIVLAILRVGPFGAGKAALISGGGNYTNAVNFSNTTVY